MGFFLLILGAIPLFSAAGSGRKTRVNPEGNLPVRLDDEVWSPTKSEVAAVDELYKEKITDAHYW